MSQVFLSGPQSGRGLAAGLQILAHYHGVPRSAVTLLDEGAGELYIEASFGLEPAGRTARYRLGEGITGSGGRHGQADRRAGGEPGAADSCTGAARRASRPGHRVSLRPDPARPPAVGACRSTFPSAPARDHDRVLKYLHVVSSLIALALKTHAAHRPGAGRAAGGEQPPPSGAAGSATTSRNLIGTSAEMRDVCAQISQVAGASTTVLIRGESGTGKELIAHAHPRQLAPGREAVHQGQLRRAARDAARVGAVRPRARRLHRRRARRRRAASSWPHGGTLFLDEIGELHARPPR